MPYSKEFIQETIKVWQPYSKEKLTEEDAREIADNVINLYTFMLELERKYKTCEEKSKKEAN